MALLPDVAQPNTAAAILKGYEDAHKEQHRMHLGASLIGRECSRQLWYTFRWADTEPLTGQKLRLFQTGHLQERRLLDDLTRIGVVVSETGADGGQWSVRTLGGHFGCSLDGAALGLPEAPKTWHSLEFKTANQKNFDKIVKEGVAKAKPEHHAQMIVGMELAGLERAMYIVVNKNTDEVYSDRVRADSVAAKRLIAKAEGIIRASEPPARLSERADFWQCKFCKFAPICHGERAPEANCRTCAHSTPDLAGDGGRWLCGNEKLAGMPVISEALQRRGCEEHRFIPIFLARTAKPTDFVDGVVVYETTDGGVFGNGNGKLGTFTSQEIRNAGTPLLLPAMAALKAEFATAKVVAA